MCEEKKVELLLKLIKIMYDAEQMLTLDDTVEFMKTAADLKKLGLDITKILKESK